MAKLFNPMSAFANSAAPISTTSETTASCWSCGEMRAAHFCSSCGKLQPPAPADYFTFFGLPRKLNLDVEQLERSFYELSRRLHPDLYAQADQREQSWSLEKSSQLNNAYRTLKDPVQRTEYLLRLEGVQLEEQSREATEEARAAGTLKKQVVPPALLEEVFELNMQLEEMRTSRKMGESDPELQKDLETHKEKLEKDVTVLFDELKGYWDEWDNLLDRQRHRKTVADAEYEQVRQKMVDLLNRRNYLRNLVRDVNEALGT